MSAYCARSDLDNIFGSENVRIWADLNNSGDSEEVDDRVDWAIAAASSKIDNRLAGGPYEVPFSETFPTEVVEMTARLAGVLLYEGRGVTDTNPVTGAPVNQVAVHKRLVDEFIQDIKAGRMRLVGATRLASFAPFVVE